MAKQVLSVGVDPIGQLRNTRKQFTDPLAFVEELYQNAQRAKADSIWWLVKPDEIRVRDNGKGCTEFDKLFTQSISGWDAETVEEEEAFGIGFFSSILAADLIEVRSGNKRAVFDVAAMFAENRLDVVSLATLTEKQSLDGFEIKMLKLREEVKKEEAQILSKIKVVGKYLPIRAFVGGKRVEQSPPMAITKEDSTAKFLNQAVGDGYRAVLYLSPSTYRYPMAYYQNRPVTTMYGLPAGMGGRVFIENGAVDLRCPDRKDFIWNSKYTDLKELLSGEAKRLARKVLETGTQRDLDRFESVIDGILEAGELVDLIRFDKASPSKEELDKFEAGMKALAEEHKGMEKIPGHKLEDLWEEVAKAPTEVVTEPAPPIHLDGVERVYNLAPPEPQNIFDPDKIEAPNQMVTKEKPSKPKKDTDPRAIDQGVAWQDLPKEPLFWCEVTEARDHLPLLQELASVGARVLLVRNRLQKKVIAEKTENAIHVRNAVRSWKQHVEITEDGPRTDAEAAAIDALNAIEKLLRKEEDFTGKLFNIGKVNVYTELEISGVEFPKTKKKIEVYAIAHRSGIWMNRDVVTFEGLRPGDQSWIRWVMLNMETISHELAHILDHTKDDTLDHYRCQLRIQGLIIDSLFKR